MIKIILSVVVFMFCAITYAGLSKTINITSAGKLSSLITAFEKTTITDFTVTGNIDARDFKCMRDEMTVLANVDLSSAIIKAYYGDLGTYFDGNMSYPADELPIGAFSPKYMDGIPKGKKTLIDVKMPVSITSIGSIAFSNCSNLTGNLVIPNLVTIIKEGAFADCTGFNGTLTLPSMLTAIEMSAFQNCSGLTGNLIIPQTVTTIGDFGFMFCSGFNGSLSFGNSVTNIGLSAFSNCNGLTGQLIIPKEIASISDYCFEECSKFSELVIPKNTVSIGDNSFFNCSGVTKITVDNVNPPQILSTTFDGINKISCNVTVQTGAAPAYKNANYWKDFSIYNEMNLNTGVLSLQAKFTIKTTHQNNEIVIEGIPDNKIVSVYDTMGKLILKIKSNGEQTILKVKKDGVFLVKINDTVLKVKL